jgi:hypothetical protein
MADTTPEQVDISKDEDDKVGDMHIFYISFMKLFCPNFLLVEYHRNKYCSAILSFIICY